MTCARGHRLGVKYFADLKGKNCEISLTELALAESGVVEHCSLEIDQPN